LTVNGYLVGHQAMVEAIVPEAGEDPELCAQELEIFAVLAQYSRITTTAIVESYVETIEGERADRETDRRQFLEEVLSRRGADRASLARRAATLGLELGRSQVVVIVELARNGAPVTWTRQWCGDALARDCGRGRSRAFVVIGSEDVVAVLDAAGSFNARTVLNRVWRAAPMPEGDQLRAGIGSPFSDIEGFVVSFGEARRALRHTTPGRTIVVSPDEVTLLDDLALSARDTAERLISDRTRQALQDPSLRETLDAYVKANMNVAAAGEALIMHPNTVRYRLRRIAELTGRDPRRITDLFELRTAARILDASSDGAEVSQFAE
jgi:sugar diacid utilization regulator